MDNNVRIHRNGHFRRSAAESCNWERQNCVDCWSWQFVTLLQEWRSTTFCAVCTSRILSCCDFEITLRKASGKLRICKVDAKEKLTNLVLSQLSQRVCWEFFKLLINLLSLYSVNGDFSWFYDYVRTWFSNKEQEKHKKCIQYDLIMWFAWATPTNFAQINVITIRNWTRY